MLDQDAINEIARSVMMDHHQAAVVLVTWGSPGEVLSSVHAMDFLRPHLVTALRALADHLEQEYRADQGGNGERQ